MSGIEANRGQVAAALLQWGAGFEVTQLGSGAPFENDVFGADSIPERGRALAAANPQLSTPDDVLAALSACLHHVRPERHHKQMTMVYSGEISVVQVVLGEEGPRRMWPLCWLYAEHGGTVQEFFAWIAQFAIMDDFTELHLYKMMAACEDECLVCAPGNVWMYLCAAAKALSNSLGEHERLQVMTCCFGRRSHRWPRVCRRARTLRLQRRRAAARAAGGRARAVALGRRALGAGAGRPGRWAQVAPRRQCGGHAPYAGSGRGGHASLTFR